MGLGNVRNITYFESLPFCPLISGSIIDNRDEVYPVQASVTHPTTRLRMVLPISLAVRALTTPALHLESLTLRGSGRHGYLLYVTLPSNILVYQALKVRYVAPSRCSVFRDLTYLEIFNPAAISYYSPESIQQADDRALPLLDQLLSILEVIPTLELLILRYFLPRQIR